ncbi:glycerophosphodiester phosphodiesterase GDPDL3-like [Lolium perenne]|uniref:glycerophosphodiester phosphodiesterase GDPDL3-like n=1 Tax=Lolium perenne TaxID=4522 RepID=UPI0021F56FBA|nr:glycerophosphodiester phosphodiesterase GDPDL3-like [Lolium perenne]
MRGSRVYGDGGGGGGLGKTAAFLAAVVLCGLLLLTGGADAQGIQPVSSHKTLRGEAPLVIAKGGFSGVFPGSSQDAYNFAALASMPDTSWWCDVQLTKDAVGICLGNIDMKNSTTIATAYPARKSTYVVDGAPKAGWFSVDFNMSELQTVALTQSIWSRTDKFDYYGYAILSVTDLPTIVKRPSLWLNVQHDIFYRQHGLSMRSYMLSILKRVSVNYISSPELGFLQSIAPRVGSKTKLVYRFPDKLTSDPSTNQTYSSMLSNLTFIKTIASGIMVPKIYIWPVSDDNYLKPPESIVQDAHKAGLEIYASDFANDRIIPYNYSYDPLQEYLSFVSNGDFSVDGVLTDFPITASEAIGCFNNLNASKADHGKPLIISHNGASGDYPDCTDLAYQNAIKDGADMIDCTLQVTSDGVLICMSSINLLETTNVQRTSFSNLASVIPAMQPTTGVFTFNLTWENISNSALTPKMSSPWSNYYLVRNPRYTNEGKFLKFTDFLEYGKNKDLSGIMVIIENAAFMAKSLGFDIIESVTTALSDAGYSNQTAKEVMIQSEDSAVLVKFKQQKTQYKLVYTLPQGIGDASNSSLADIKEFADAVVVDKKSVFAQSLHFIINQTNLLKDLQSAGLAVYAQVFSNEFVSQPWDFFSDATVEINSYVQTLKIDGLITDFPKTVRRYKRNSCTGLGDNTPVYMQTVNVGDLAKLIKSQGVPGAQPPAVAPMPVLNTSSVEQPAFPPVSPKGSTPGASPPPGSSPSAAYAVAASTCSLLVAVCAALLI